MLNLIKVEFKSNILKFVPIALLVLITLNGAGVGALNVATSSDLFDFTWVFENFTAACLCIPVISSVIIVRDFEDNTIRNKLCVGHSRSNVYFAKFFSILLYSLIVLAFNMIAVYFSQKKWIGISDHEVLLLLYIYLVFIGFSVFFTGLSLILSVFIKKMPVIFISALLGFVFFNILFVLMESLLGSSLEIESFADISLSFAIFGFILCLLGYLKFNNSDLN